MSSEKEDLFDLEPPSEENHLERIYFFARVLAYGALTGKWISEFHVYRNFGDGGTWKLGICSDECVSQFSEYLEKWGDNVPLVSNLVAFGYLERLGEFSEGTFIYQLTQKAFELLEKPARPPNVFISYCRETSSAFALAIEYRLRAEQFHPYIDRSIPAGDDWHTQLKERIQSCQYFVCLITEKALESKTVRKEIEWAENQVRIPVWQPSFNDHMEGVDYSGDIQGFVNGTQAIRVMEESAEAYYNAVEALLNRLGFGLP